VWHTAPAKTIAEAKRTELIMGATGKGSNSFQDIALANNLLGTRFKAVRVTRAGPKSTSRSSAARYMGARRRGRHGPGRIRTGCATRSLYISLSSVPANSRRSATTFRCFATW